MTRAGVGEKPGADAFGNRRPARHGGTAGADAEQSCSTRRDSAYRSPESTRRPGGLPCRALAILRMEGGHATTASCGSGPRAPRPVTLTRPPPLGPTRNRPMNFSGGGPPIGPGRPWSGLAARRHRGRLPLDPREPAPYDPARVVPVARRGTGAPHASAVLLPVLLFSPEKCGSERLRPTASARVVSARSPCAPSRSLRFSLAPRGGLEPPTHGLTVRYSTN